MLHVCWQTNSSIQGSYMIGLLYTRCLCLAVCEKAAKSYMIQACIPLNKCTVEDTDNGRGMPILLGIPHCVALPKTNVLFAKAYNATPRRSLGRFSSNVTASYMSSSYRPELGRRSWNGGRGLKVSVGLATASPCHMDLHPPFSTWKSSHLEVCLEERAVGDPRHFE